MSGRRNLAVTWGICPPEHVDTVTGIGVGWSRVAGVRGDKLHLTPFAEYAMTAICGAPASDPASFASGHLCRRCADVAGVRSTDDLRVDETEDGWSRAQREPAAAGAVVHEPSAEPYRNDAASEIVPECPDCGAPPAQAHDPLCPRIPAPTVERPTPRVDALVDLAQRALGRAEITVDAIADDPEPSRYDVETAARLLSVLGRQSIIGRDRVLVDKVTEQLLAGVRTKHEHTDASPTKRGAYFDLRLDGTTHVVRVSVDLLRVEP